MTNRKVRRIILKTLQVIVLVLICVFLVGPFLVLISNSFKTEAEIGRTIPTIIPASPTLANFGEIYKDRTFMINMFNSFKIAVATMLVAMCIALPSSYAIARVRSGMSKYIQVWILLSQMVPGITLVVPLYLILKNMGLTNTHLGLIIVYSVWSLPFAIWMMRGFIEGLSHELEEAAFIDGCNLIKMFTKILFPLLLPGILTAGIFAFLGSWNEFFFALCLMKSAQLQTLPSKLYSYIGLGGQARKGMLAAGSFIATIPGLLVFMIFQGYYVKGMTSGAIK